MGYVKLLSQEGRNAIFLIGIDEQYNPWSSKFNATILTDSTFLLTRQNHEDYHLEDSIVMVKYYPKGELEDGRWIIERYKLKHRN